MRDQAVRLEVGISVRNAAKIIGVSYPTVRMYEADPGSVKTPDKREACELFYRELRRLMSRVPLTREAREIAE